MGYFPNGKIMLVLFPNGNILLVISKKWESDILIFEREETPSRTIYDVSNSYIIIGMEREK